MTTNSLLVFLLVVFGAAGTASAQVTPGTPAPSPTSAPAMGNQCPASIQVQQTPTGALATGWQAQGSARTHPLTNIAFYAGPPEEMVQLAPDSEQRKGKTLTSRWPLTPVDRVYWVACEYAGTSAKATRPLDQSVTSCVAEHDLNTSPPMLKRWSCGSRRTKQ